MKLFQVLFVGLLLYTLIVDRKPLSSRPAGIKILYYLIIAAGIGLWGCQALGSPVPLPTQFFANDLWPWFHRRFFHLNEFI
jgi:hypothetical protein